MEIRERTIKEYVANDGRLFYRESECIAHEKEILFPASWVGKVSFYRQNGTEITNFYAKNWYKEVVFIHIKEDIKWENWVFTIPTLRGWYIYGENFNYREDGEWVDIETLMWNYTPIKDLMETE